MARTSKPRGRCGGLGLCSCGADVCDDPWAIFCAQWVTGIGFAISERMGNARRDDAAWEERVRWVAGGEEDEEVAA